MIIISPSGTKFEYIAIKLHHKQKIHFKHKNGSTCCSITPNKINLESDTVEIDNIDSLNDFVGILNQKALCKKCKESLEQAVYVDYQLFVRSGDAIFFKDKSEIEKDLREIQRLEIQQKLKELRGNND